ncbi:hypothetical protein L2E82_51243 [Cichorium intybus]|nr:hypothetical protein L2E82_51243 [Cichorium intybus]
MNRSTWEIDSNMKRDKQLVDGSWLQLVDGALRTNSGDSRGSDGGGIVRVVWKLEWFKDKMGVGAAAMECGSAQKVVGEEVDPTG